MCPHLRFIYNHVFYFRPEHNDIYSCLDTIPEFTLPRRKSVALVSDLVSYFTYVCTLWNERERERERERED